MASGHKRWFVKSYDHHTFAEYTDQIGGEIECISKNESMFVLGHND